MKIVFSRHFPISGFVAINLFGVLVVRKEYEIFFDQHTEWTDELIRHESIHTEQMKEMLYIGFYVWYLLAWIVKVILPPWNSAYMDISLEREAYAYENVSNYIEYRKHYAWIKFIFNNKRK